MRNDERESRAMLNESPEFLQFCFHADFSVVMLRSGYLMKGASDNTEGLHVSDPGRNRGPEKTKLGLSNRQTGSPRKLF